MSILSPAGDPADTHWMSPASAWVRRKFSCSNSAILSFNSSTTNCQRSSAYFVARLAAPIWACFACLSVGIGYQPSQLLWSMNPANGFGNPTLSLTQRSVSWCCVSQSRNVASATLTPSFMIRMCNLLPSSSHMSSWNSALSQPKESDWRA